MSVKTLRNQLLAAIAMTLVAAIALGSSTFAWFSLNSTVSVTGMAVTTQVNNNLLISWKDENGDNHTIATNAVPADNTFKTSAIQYVNGLLQPVSTVDGKQFFYTNTKNVAGNGAHLQAAFIKYQDDASTTEVPTATEIQKFNNNAGTTTGNDPNYQYPAVGFVDYVFFLKAQNTLDDTGKIIIKDINLAYGGDEITNDMALAEKAFRVAVFSSGVLTKEQSITTMVNKTDELRTILMSDTDTDGSRYFEQDNNHKAMGVNTTTSLAAVNHLSEAAVIGTVAQGATNYYRVIVRLWLEGEDTTCNNTTFMNFKDKWSLDMTLEMVNDTQTSVTHFDAFDISNRVANATKVSVAGKTIADNTPAAFVIDNVSYYAISESSLDYNGESKQLYTNAIGNIGANSRIFILVDNNTHPYDVTNQVTLTAPNP